jgi:hypothetical protein
VPEAWERRVAMCDAATGKLEWDSGLCAFAPGTRARPMMLRLICFRLYMQHMIQYDSMIHRIQAYASTRVGIFGMPLLRS